MSKKKRKYTLGIVNDMLAAHPQPVMVDPDMTQGEDGIGWSDRLYNHPISIRCSEHGRMWTAYTAIRLAKKVREQTCICPYCWPDRSGGYTVDSVLAKVENPSNLQKIGARLEVITAPGDIDAQLRRGRERGYSGEKLKSSVLLDVAIVDRMPMLAYPPRVTRTLQQILAGSLGRVSQAGTSLLHYILARGLAMMDIPYEAEVTLPGMLSPQGHPMRVDIWLSWGSMVIEVDGRQHEDSDAHQYYRHHSTDSFDHLRARDGRKDAYCRANGIRMMRVPAYVTTASGGWRPQRPRDAHEAAQKVLTAIVAEYYADTPAPMRPAIPSMEVLMERRLTSADDRVAGEGWSIRRCRMHDRVRAAYGEQATYVRRGDRDGIVILRCAEGHYIARTTCTIDRHRDHTPSDICPDCAMVRRVTSVQRYLNDALHAVIVNYHDIVHSTGTPTHPATHYSVSNVELLLRPASGCTGHDTWITVGAAERRKRPFFRVKTMARVRADDDRYVWSGTDTCEVRGVMTRSEVVTQYHRVVDDWNRQMLRGDRIEDRDPPMVSSIYADCSRRWAERAHRDVCALALDGIAILSGPENVYGPETRYAIRHHACGRVSYATRRSMSAAARNNRPDTLCRNRECWQEEHVDLGAGSCTPSRKGVPSTTRHSVEAVAEWVSEQSGGMLQLIHEEYVDTRSSAGVRILAGPESGMRIPMSSVDNWQHRGTLKKIAKAIADERLPSSVVRGVR